MGFWPTHKFWRGADFGIVTTFYYLSVSCCMAFDIILHDDTSMHLHNGSNYKTSSRHYLNTYRLWLIIKRLVNVFFLWSVHFRCYSYVMLRMIKVWQSAGVIGTNKYKLATNTEQSLSRLLWSFKLKGNTNLKLFCRVCRQLVNCGSFVVWQYSLILWRHQCRHAVHSAARCSSSV